MSGCAWMCVDVPVCMDRQTDTQTDRQTDRQAGRQAASPPAGQPASQADKQTDRQTERERERGRKNERKKDRFEMLLAETRSKDNLFLGRLPGCGVYPGRLSKRKRIHILYIYTGCDLLFLFSSCLVCLELVNPLAPRLAPATRPTLIQL